MFVLFLKLEKCNEVTLVGVPTLSQKQVLGSSIFASWGGTHRAQKTKNITGEHGLPKQTDAKLKNIVSSDTYKPSFPAMDQRLLLNSPLAKNNTSPQRCPAWLGTRVAIAEKLPLLSSLPYLSCQVVSTSPTMRWGLIVVV